MIGLEQVRAWALALPEAEESTHFRLPAFKVRGKTFVVVQNEGTHVIVHVDQDTAEAAVAADSAACEEIWRNGGTSFVGVRVELESSAATHARQLVELGWRNKAPRRLVSAHDERASA